VAKDQLTSSASRAYYEFIELSAGPGINTPPDAVNDSAVTTQNSLVSISVLTNDTDADGDTLTVESVTQPDLDTGTVSINPDQKTVTYTPPAGFIGTASFTYTISDGRGDIDTATVTVTVTVTVPPGNTDFQSPTVNAPVTSSAGDNNGFQTSAANARANDGIFAVDTNSGTGSSTSCTSSQKDKHRFNTYNFSIPGGSTVKGIEVRLDARVDSTSGSPRLCVQLSWNGGATWTTAKATPTLTTSEATHVLGSATDLWGRTWSNSEFGNNNFSVRVISVASSTSRDFSLDWVAVRVTYQP
jgi:hypothetical protein